MPTDLWWQVAVRLITEKSPSMAKPDKWSSGLSLKNSLSSKKYELKNIKKAKLHGSLNTTTMYHPLSK